MMSSAQRRDLLKLIGVGSIVGGVSQPISAQSNKSDPVVFAVTDTGPDISFGSDQSQPDNEGATLIAINSESGNIIWTFDDPDGDIWSPPIVVDGTVYFGSQDKHLYAVDAESGDEVWAGSYGNMNTAPTIVDGIVYIGTRRGVSAIKSDSGELVWHYDGSRTRLQVVPSNGRDTIRIRSSPQVTNGVVYVGADNSNLYAINASTGVVLWETEIIEDGTGSNIRTPTVYDGTVYVGAQDGYLHAVDALTGEKKWKTEGGLDRHAPPVAYNDTIYTGQAGVDHFLALDHETGEIKWSIDGEELRGDINGARRGGMRYAPAIEDGVAYISLPNYRIQAIDLATKEMLWSTPLPAEESEKQPFPVPLTPPTVYNGVVYAGGREFGTSFNGWYGVNIKSGELEWKVKSGSFDASPTVVRDTASGHSVDSRVDLGVFGHHHTWAEETRSRSPEGPDFNITNVEFDEAVTESESIDVRVEIKNNGDFVDQQPVYIGRNAEPPEVISRANLSLQGNQTREHVFEDIEISDPSKEYAVWAGAGLSKGYGLWDLEVGATDRYLLEFEKAESNGDTEQDQSINSSSNETSSTTSSENVAGFGPGAAAVAIGGFIKLADWISSTENES